MTLGRLWAMAGEPEQARPHFLESIRIRDDGMHRTLWAIQLEEWEQCKEAEGHAQNALNQARHEEPGFNSHAEANTVLARCAWSNGRTELGHKHMSEAHRLARETGYDIAVPDSSKGR